MRTELGKGMDIGWVLRAERYPVGRAGRVGRVGLFCLKLA